MKRNKLMNSHSQATMYDTGSSNRKYRHIFSLSLLAITGVFLTSIVLATSEPNATETSSVISLPKQTSEDDHSKEQQIALKPLQNIYATPTQPITLEEVTTAKAQERSIEDDFVDERAEVELLHIQEQTTVEPNTVVEAQNVVEQPTNLDWQEVTVKSGDNLSLIFPRVGLTARDVYNVAQAGDDIKPLLNLKPGQSIKFGLSKAEDKNKLEIIELKRSQLETLRLTATDNGFSTETLVKETEKRQSQVYGSINSSLFEAGLDAGMSDRLIMEMAHIFGWDIDFALDIRQGDSFKVIFEETYLDGNKIKDGDILAAEFTNQGKTFKAIRYTDAEGNSHFYAPNGDSMRKTFSRTPVHFSRISSRFNPNRKHPVLKTSRPHKGVDYAAPTGTPILATGDGKVEYIGTKGGYGRTVILSHGGKYTTLYAHMSKYKSGLKRGHRVKQGQTIGYIGQSGLATGPHLHYEFRVNGVHRNPLTVALPKAEPLNKKYLSDFQAKSAPLLAKLDQIELPLLASNQ